MVLVTSKDDGDGHGGSEKPLSIAVSTLFYNSCKSGWVMMALGGRRMRGRQVGKAEDNNVGDQGCNGPPATFSG
uniref:Uncharacterized protein n=1 Tax=Oryza glumipatula TaxID=40148 RepID=A0A0D9YWB4_9ORYZ